MLNVKFTCSKRHLVLIDNQELAVYWLSERWVILLNMHIHTFRYQMMVREQWMPEIGKYLKRAENALLFLIASFYNPLGITYKILPPTCWKISMHKHQRSPSGNQWACSVEKDFKVLLAADHLILNAMNLSPLKSTLGRGLLSLHSSCVVTQHHSWLDHLVLSY